MHGNQITTWKNQLLEGSAEIFATKAEKAAYSQGPTVEQMQAKIGQLTLENDFLERALDRVPGKSAKR